MTEPEPQTGRELYRLSQAQPFPCWPDQPRYVVFLTRDLDKFLVRLAVSLVIIWPILFEVEPQIDTLWTAVFGKDTVSHFAFIRGQYEYLAALQKIERLDPAGHPQLADFHMLEIATWLGIAMTATRSVTGIAFLRQYDARYLIISRHFMMNFFSLTLVIIWLAFCLYFLTDVTFYTKTAYPRAYWSMTAYLYSGVPFAIVKVLHIVVWKVFRQNWPWARLWQPNMQADRAPSGSAAKAGG